MANRLLSLVAGGSKSALVDKVAEEAGVSKKDTKAVVDALISTVIEEVKKDAEYMPKFIIAAKVGLPFR